ncbi:MAG: helix-turn-helix domain-containing protein [Ruminococcus sp.]
MRNFKYPVLDAKRTGRKIKEACRQKNLSVREIQESLGLGSFQAVYRWFSGQTLPSLDNMYALSQLLQKPMESLLVSEKEPASADIRPLPSGGKIEERLTHYWKYLISKAA